MAATWNFTIEQGTYWSDQYEYQDADGGPIDLTGWSAQMEARRTPEGPVVFSLATPGAPEVSTPTGTITLGGAAGTLLLELQADATALIGGTEPERFIYDLELVPPDGKTFRLIEGSIMLSPEVTR